MTLGMGTASCCGMICALMCVCVCARVGVCVCVCVSLSVCLCAGVFPRIWVGVTPASFLEPFRTPPWLIVPWWMSQQETSLLKPFTHPLLTRVAAATLVGCRCEPGTSRSTRTALSGSMFPHVIDWQSFAYADMCASARLHISMSMPNTSPSSLLSASLSSIVYIQTDMHAYLHMYTR